MDESEPVLVYVRVRPEQIDNNNGQSPTRNSFSNHPLKNLKCVTQIDETTLRVTPPDGAHGQRKNVAALDDKMYSFDRVFAEDSTQEELYASVVGMVNATVRGYNTTIFAYGSTGSGKSYTMTGNGSAPGIIPRAISSIFATIESTAKEENDSFFYVRLSYVELYNDTFRNLLDFASKELATRENSMEASSQQDGNSPARDKRSSFGSAGLSAGGGEKISVRESHSAGVFLAGAHLRIPVTTPQEAFQLIARGNRQRAVGSTQCNDVSSRSHAVLTIHVESRVAKPGSINSGSSDPLNVTAPMTMTGAAAPDSELRLGKMHLVDLAGSERLGLSGAEGDTLVETQAINLSLSALGDVLSALSRNAAVLSKGGGFTTVKSATGAGTATYKVPVSLVPVPYRNSKLTHLLKDSLGGNSKTIMITNIRTHSDYYQQTAVSLMYASRAKKVKNRSLVNRNIIGDTGIHAVTKEIERLKARLEDRSTEFERLRELHMRDSNENNTLKSRLQELKAANESEKVQLETQMSHVIHSQAGQLASQKQKISTLQQALQDELAVSQNRIAEQEREILWLKVALEDSAKSAQQPKEQLERMQKVVEGWQAQVQSTQHELAKCVQLNEHHKEQISVMTVELTESEFSRQQLQEEIKEREQDIAELTATCSKNDKFQDQLLKTRDAVTADNVAIAAKLKSCSEHIHTLEMEIKQKNHQLTRVTHDVTASQEEVKAVKLALSKKTAQCGDADREVMALRNKLTSTVTALEQQSSSTIEEITHRNQLFESKARKAEDKLTTTEARLKSLQAELADAQAGTTAALSQRDRQVAEMRAILRTEQQARLAAEQKVGTADANINALTEKISKLNVILQQDQTTSSSLQADLMRLQQRYSADMEARMTEINHFRDELLQNERINEALTNDHKSALALLKTEFAAKENQFQRHLREVEQQVRTKISDEVQLGMKSLQDQLVTDSQLIREEEACKLDTELAAQQAQHESRISELRQAHAKDVQSLMSQHRDALDQAVESNTRRMHAESEAEVEAVRVQLFQIVKEGENAHAAELLAVNNRLTELIKSQEQLSVSHSLAMTELQARLDSAHQEAQLALDNVKAKSQEQVRAAIAVYKQKVDQKYQERKAALQARETQVQALQESLEKRQSDLEDENKQLSQQGREYAESVSKREEQLKQDHLDEVDRIQQEHDVDLQRERERLTAEHDILQAQALQAERKTLEMEYQESMRELQSISEQELADQLKAFRRDLETQHQRLRGAELDDLRVQMSTDHEAHVQTRLLEQGTRLEQEYQAKLNKLVSENSSLLHSARTDAKEDFSRALDMELEKALQAQNRQLTQEYQLSRHQLEDSIQGLREESRALVVQHQAELYQSLNEQQVQLSESHRMELERLRHEKQDQERRHQQELALVTTERLSEKTQQRQSLETTHDKMMEAMQDELTQAKQRYHDLVAQSASRQGLEAKSIKQQRDEFDQILTTSLAERDARHKQALKVLSDSQEAERQRLLASLDRLRSQQKDELAQKDADISAEMVRREAVLKEKFTREMLELEAKHTASATALVNEVNTRHRQAMTNVRDESAAMEAQLQQLLQEATAQQQELSLTLARQRVQHESEKMQQSDAMHAEQLAMESRHRAALVFADAKYQEQLSRVTSALQQQLKINQDESAVEIGRLQADTALRIKAGSEAASAKIATSHEDFVRQKQELQSEIASLKQQHQIAVQSMKSHHSEEFSSRLASLEENYLSQLSAVKTELRDQEERYRQELACQSEVIQSCRIEIDASKSREQAIQLSASRAERDHQHAMAEEELKHRGELQRLAEDHAFAMQDKLSSLTLQLQLTHKNVLDALRDEQTAKTQDLTAYWQEQLHSAQVSITAAESARSDTELELQRVKLQLETSAQALATQQATSQASKTSLQSQLRDALAQHEEAVARMHREHLEEMEAEKAANDLQMQASVSHHTLQLQEISANHVSTTREMQAKWNDECKVQREQHETEQSRLQQLTSSLTQDLAAAHNRQQSLQDQLTASEGDKVACQDQLNTVNEEKEMLLDSINKLEQTVVDEIQRSVLEQVQAECLRLETVQSRENQSLQIAHDQVLTERDSLREELEHVSQAVAQYRETADCAVAESDRVQAMYKKALADREATFDDNLKRALAAQHDELQGGYLALLQQQVDSLMTMVLAQSKQTPNVDDMQTTFMSLLQNLPELWKQHHGGFVDNNSNKDALVVHMTEEELLGGGGQEIDADYNNTPNVNHNSGRTEFARPKARVPMHLLVGTQEDKDKARDATLQAMSSVNRSLHNRASSGGGAAATSVLTNNNNINTAGKWTAAGHNVSSSNTRVSSTDQLIAAIIDGDVQGVRAVVRSKGDDLRSEYWRELAQSILPLHRAISGLHFHGSEKLLLSTIETLCQLGADVNAADHVGGTALHKAIQICTSKSVVAVVQCLLSRGAQPNRSTKEGETPLHMECKRIRTASVEVIAALLQSGADASLPSVAGHKSSSSSSSALVLVLLQGAALAGAHTGLSHHAATGLWPTAQSTGDINNSSLDLSVDRSVTGTLTATGQEDKDKTQLSAKKNWVRVAELLLKSGAQWDANWRAKNNFTQLHLLMCCFPPAKEEASSYRYLVSSALDMISTAVEDDRGRNALFVLCEQLAVVSNDSAPNSPRILRMLIESSVRNHPKGGSSSTGGGIGGSDRAGRTLFDIEDKVPQSCLSVCRALLVEATMGKSSAGAAAVASGTVHMNATAHAVGVRSSLDSTRSSSEQPLPTAVPYNKPSAQRLSFPASVMPLNRRDRDRLHDNDSELDDTPAPAALTSHSGLLRPQYITHNYEHNNALDNLRSNNNNNNNSSSHQLYSEAGSLKIKSSDYSPAVAARRPASTPRTSVTTNNSHSNTANNFKPPRFSQSLIQRDQ